MFLFAYVNYYLYLCPRQITSILIHMTQLSPLRRKKMEESLSQLPESRRRDAATDYFEGYFSVTLTVRDHAPVLGILTGHIGAKEGKDVPHNELSELGALVQDEWEKVPSHHPNVQMIAIQVMPDHIHGLLYMKKLPGMHLGRIVGGFMIGCTHHYWDCLGIDWRSMKNARPMQDRDHTRSYRGPSLFVRGYNDVQPVSQQELAIKIEYYRTNPERRLIKGQLYDRFVIGRGLRNRKWTESSIRAALTGDRRYARDAWALEIAWHGIQDRLNEKTVMDDVQTYIDVVGNRRLFEVPVKRSLICHRADAVFFEQQKKAVMTAARGGAVIVSAFISPREREIRKLLLAEGLPVIEIVDNGFGQLYKPMGQAFYACAENRLAQMTPWKYKYQRHAVVTREMCLVMNELVRLVCGVRDDWWRVER
mgnify:CR=1 FL=1